jgi:hypothetical protein
VGGKYEERRAKDQKGNGRDDQVHLRKLLCLWLIERCFSD